MANRRRITDVTAAACCEPMVDGAPTESAAIDVAKGFKALGDPVRLRLLSLIAACTHIPCCGGGCRPRRDMSGALTSRAIVRT